MKRKIKDLAPREKLHLMVNMLDDAYLEEAQHSLSHLVSKSVEDGPRDRGRAKRD